MTEIKLLPCPFCGAEPESKQDGSKGWKIKCPSCIMMYKQKTIRHSLEWLREQMCENWNKRIRPILFSDDYRQLEKEVNENFLGLNEFIQDESVFEWYKGLVREFAMGYYHMGKAHFIRCEENNGFIPNQSGPQQLSDVHKQKLFEESNGLTDPGDDDQFEPQRTLSTCSVPNYATHIHESEPAPEKKAEEAVESFEERLDGWKQNIANKKGYEQWCEIVVHEQMEELELALEESVDTVRVLWKKIMELTAQRIESAPIGEDEIEKMGICVRCRKRDATKDYNGHKHFVCDPCYEFLNDEFDDEYN